MKEKFHGGLTSFNDFDFLLALISALILNEISFLPFLKDFKTRVKVMDRQRESKDRYIQKDKTETESVHPELLGYTYCLSTCNYG